MVVSIVVQHVFRFPVEMVFKTYVEGTQSGPESSAKSVLNVELIKEGCMTCLKRLLTYSNFIPSYFRRDPVLNVESIIIEEECWSEIEGDKHWIRSRNLTWEEDAVIAHSVYLCPDKHNPQWSRWDQDSALDFGSFGKLGYIIELYLKRVLESKIKKDLTDMETVMAKQISRLKN